jgi:hypothetical protein
MRSCFLGKLHMESMCVLHLHNNILRFFNYMAANIMKGSPGTAVKVLPCDHEVMGSSPVNSLLQKCR